MVKCSLLAVFVALFCVLTRKSGPLDSNHAEVLYQSASPDEEALVKGAEKLGFVFRVCCVGFPPSFFLSPIPVPSFRTLNGVSFVS